jgi:hypothetical protein
VYSATITELNAGKFDAALAEHNSWYCHAIQVAYEKIRSGGKKSKTELSSKKADVRSDRAKKNAYLALEKQMGKVIENTDSFIDDEAQEEGSSFGRILTPDWMEDVDDSDIRKWDDLLQALIPSAAASSTHGGNHNVIVLYEIAHARVVRQNDLSSTGILVTLTTTMDVCNSIQEILEEKDFEMLSLVCISMSLLCLISIVIVEFSFCKS